MLDDKWNYVQLHVDALYIVLKKALSLRRRQRGPAGDKSTEHEIQLSWAQALLLPLAGYALVLF